jgi:ferric-chelate reductase (NADPH)
MTEIKRPGRLEGALTRFFMKSATVREVRRLAADFHLVTLSGESLRGGRWAPGQKVQMALGGWVYRTYTPISWDAAEGSTQLLLFLHGEAPAACWGRALKEGDACTLFGPRDSLDVNALGRPALLFGDETSIGLAYALRSTPQGAGGARVVLEVTSKPVAAQVIEQLGIPEVDLFERKPDDLHLNEVEAVVVDQLRSHEIKSVALSGKAPSIQRLNKRLRALGVAGLQIRTRAYWAPGKVGLD